MGISILEMVMRRMQSLNFLPGLAYPGQKFPKVTQTMAAVHLEKVDRANMTVTVEVTIVCPAAMGGTACEVEALRATEGLRWDGAQCVQNGCTYDGVAQVYMVPILATFPGIAEEEDFLAGPGFEVYLDGRFLPYVQAFREEESTGWQPEYVAGTCAPAAYSQTGARWGITLEEQTPAGTRESEEPAGEFTLAVTAEGRTVTYAGCRWTSVSRSRDARGLRKLRTGYARSREVE